MKHLIATGEMGVIDAIVSGSPEIERMAVIELLLSQTGWGYARARGFLMAVPLPESKTVGAMTARQRGLLAALLEDKPQRNPNGVLI